MDRIDLATVQRAYEITGLKKTRGSWGSTSNNCACPVAVVCVAMEQGHPGDVYTGPCNYAAEHLDISVSYLAGFIHAVDGKQGILSASDEWNRGYNDGVEVRKGIDIIPT